MTDTPPPMNPWKVAAQWIGGFLLMFAAMAIGLKLYQPQAVAAAKAFVAATQGFGVAAGFFVPDAVPLPVPHDLFSAAGLVGGMGFWEVVLWAHAGSIAGGCVGFTIGRRLSHTAWYQQVMQGRGAQARRIVERYGDLGVLVGALTPLPYALVCWAAGALGMGWGRFLLISQTRILRIAAYLWAIDRGILSTLDLG